MKFLRQLMIILCISLIAEIMEYVIPLPVAASMYGLVLMLAGLITHVIPMDKVENAADFLVEILPIFFIQPTVSIMASVEELKQMLVPLCVISVVSTVLVMGVTGRVSQSLLRRGGSTGGSKGSVLDPGKPEKGAVASRENHLGQKTTASEEGNAPGQEAHHE